MGSPPISTFCDLFKPEDFNTESEPIELEFDWAASLAFQQDMDRVREAKGWRRPEK